MSLRSVLRSVRTAESQRAEGPLTCRPPIDMLGRKARVTAALAIVAALAVLPGVNNSVSPAAGSSAPAQAPGFWASTGAPAVADSGSTGLAVQLHDGRVLRVGSRVVTLANAQLYDPRTGEWSATAVPGGIDVGSLTLIEGRGCEPHCGRVLAHFPNSRADLWSLYDPTAGIWLPVPPTNHPRPLGTAKATLLQGSECEGTSPPGYCGKVLVVSGYADQAKLAGLTIPELWDPATNTWSDAAPLSVGRINPGAVGLANGDVLVVSGCSWGDIGTMPGCTRTTERYIAKDNRWVDAGTVSWDTPGADMVRLGDGRVVAMIGGYNEGENAVAGIFDPGQNAWRFAPGCGGFGCGGLTRLDDDKVLAVGASPDFKTTFLFDPDNSTWVKLASSAGERPQGLGNSHTLLRGPNCGSNCGKLLAAGGTSSELYTPGPAVADVAPRLGPVAGGTRVTITGRYFTNGMTVAFGDAPATSVSDVTPNNDGTTTVTATSPPNPPGPVHVTVTTPGGTSPPTLADLFTYLSPPSLTGIVPPIGPASGGTTVTIAGFGLAGATRVSFGAAAASDVSVSADGRTITATTPAHDPGPVPVTVTVPVTGTSPASSAVQFTYGPLVAGLSPAKGPVAGGTAVSIGGKGFARATTAVRFGGIPATAYTVRSDTEIVATAPAHAKPEEVRVEMVTVEGLVSMPSAPDADLYTYTEAEVLPGTGPSEPGPGGPTERAPVTDQPALPGGGAPAQGAIPGSAPSASPSPVPAPGPAPAPAPGPGSAPGVNTGPAPGSSTSANPGTAAGSSAASGSSTSPAATAASGAAGAALPAPGVAPAPVAAGQSAGPAGNAGVTRRGDGERGLIQHAMVRRRHEQQRGGWVLAGLVVLAGCTITAADRRRARARPRPQGAY